jgi:hypothetical protein
MGGPIRHYEQRDGDVGFFDILAGGNCWTCGARSCSASSITSFNASIR